MKKITILLTFLLYLLHASAIEQIGQTWDFAENDFLDEVQEHIHKNKDLLEGRLNDSKKKAQERVKNFKPAEIINLPRASETRKFWPDMTYRLDQDIRDADGAVIYPAGFTFNPGDYVTLPYIIVLINGDDKIQVNWYESSEYNNTIGVKIIITDGEHFPLSEKFGQPIFYAPKLLVERFDIKAVPAIVQQFGKGIHVTELCIECKETEE